MLTAVKMRQLHQPYTPPQKKVLSTAPDEWISTVPGPDVASIFLLDLFADGPGSEQANPVSEMFV